MGSILANVLGYVLDAYVPGSVMFEGNGRVATVLHNPPYLGEHFGVNAGLARG